MVDSTHTKGDRALASTISSLLDLGCHVAIPLHNHLHYDLIAEYQGKCYRVQVKHAVAKEMKAVASLRTVYARKHGNVVRVREDDDYDVLAIFHPVLKDVRFIKASVLPKTSVTVDFMESKSLWE